MVTILDLVLLFPNILHCFLVLIEGAAVVAIVLIGVDLAVHEYRVTRKSPQEKAQIRLAKTKAYFAKEREKAVKREEKYAKARHRQADVKRKADERAKAKLREEKEAAAYEGFFEESYVRGFDSNGRIISRGVKIPTAKAMEYYRKMDELADTQIFLNTEEL